MTKDSRGNPLVDGDSVRTIRNIRATGADGDSVRLTRGTLLQNIRLTRTECEVACDTEKARGLVLRTEFLRKA